MTTVLLAPAHDQPIQDAHYLDAADLSKTRVLRRALVDQFGDKHWDLVICHRYRSYWSVARTALSRYPCVVVAHEYGLLKRWQRRLARRLFARRFQFAAVAPDVAAELSRVVGHASVLPNVLPDQAHPLPKEQALQQLGLPPGPITIGVVGRLHYKKRPYLALQAFAELQNKLPNARLVFIGDGDQASLQPPDFASSAAASSAPDHVIYAGRIANAAQLFSAFDVILHPAQVEAFGMVVLEAMAAGVPVVTPQQGGAAYVLGELGFYPTKDTPADLAVALERALQVDSETFKERCHTRCQQCFSVDVLARALAHLLQHPA